VRKEKAMKNTYNTLAKKFLTQGHLDPEEMGEFKKLAGHNIEMAAEKCKSYHPKRKGGKGCLRHASY